MNAAAALRDAVPTRLHGDSWRSVAGGRVELLASRCARCQALFLPRMLTCTECGGNAFTEAVLSPEGTLYSFTIVRGSGGVWPEVYAVGYVDYPEGVRVFGHLRSAEIDGLAIGARVRTEEATLYTAKDGTPARCFRFLLVTD